MIGLDARFSRTKECRLRRLTVAVDGAMHVSRGDTCTFKPNSFGFAILSAWVNPSMIGGYVGWAVGIKAGSSLSLWSTS